MIGWETNFKCAFHFSQNTFSVFVRRASLESGMLKQQLQLDLPGQNDKK